MKKTVKILAAFLAVCLMFSVCACQYTGNVVVVTSPNGGNQAAQNTPPVNGVDYGAEEPTGGASQLPNQQPNQQPNQNGGAQPDPNGQGEPLTNPNGSSVDPTANQGGTPQNTASADPSTWTKQEILTYLGKAVTKTKAYTGPVSVTRSEDLGITVEEIKPNLPKLDDIANSLIKQFIKPVAEEIQFNGGQGQSDGEMIPLLLPKRQAFTLPIDGVAQAKATKSGDNIVIDLTLVPESTSMYDKPTYNSMAIGYLDFASVDLGAITISSLDFDYKGSTIHAVILPNGYVKSAEYHIPLHVAASGKAAFISASFAGTGYQTEKWDIHWQ